MVAGLTKLARAVLPLSAAQEEKAEVRQPPDPGKKATSADPSEIARASAPRDRASFSGLARRLARGDGPSDSRVDPRSTADGGVRPANPASDGSETVASPHRRIGDYAEPGPATSRLDVRR